MRNRSLPPRPYTGNGSGTARPSLADLGIAVQFHQRGQLAQAERIYRSILEMEPRHFDATHLLGVVLLQRGEFADADKQLRRAIRLGPESAAAYCHRGIVLKEQGQFDEALKSFNRAVQLQPNYTEAFVNRGALLHLLGRFEDAVTSYGKAIALNPSFAGAFNNRGNSLKSLWRIDEALADFEAAIALNSNYPEAFNNRGLVLNEMRRRSEALESYDRAIALKPDYAEAHANRGNTLRELGRLEEALDHLNRAMALGLTTADSLNNRANVFRDMGLMEEALAGFDAAIALRPDFAEARYGRACIHLSLGRMAQSWPDYEYRFKMSSFYIPRPTLKAPYWSGESLTGRSILVYGEQGFGDQFQFSRYLALLADLGAQVSFLVRPRLKLVLEGLGGRIRVITSVEDDDPFDFQCALASLPGLMGTDTGAIPSAVPYLRADPLRAEKWAGQLGTAGFKIGICWEGSNLDPGRAVPLQEFHLLAQIPGVRLISLQKVKGLEQLQSLPPGMMVETLGDGFDSGGDAFVDTAAVMERLDLIVSTDTSIVHLAGALGRPVWLALKSVPEWRWMFGRADSPWYPTLRLFRQKERGDWGPVMSGMEAALKELLRQPAD